ncbi:hypothetical protein IT575_10205 [bacterium]|nr:hypothetical protein [bacterium]
MRCGRTIALGALGLLALLSAGCALLPQWREKQLQRYHLSRFEAFARQEAFGAGSAQYPKKPAPPKDCRETLEPLYQQAFEAQSQREATWQALLADCNELRGRLEEISGALARRDGASVAALTPELGEARDQNAALLKDWQARGAEFEGSLQSLQVKWQEVWPEGAQPWDLDAEVDRQRRSAFDAKLADAAAGQAGSGKDSDRRAAAQALEQEHIAALLKYHESLYGRLAGLYLGRETAAAKADAPAAPDFAAPLAEALAPLEDYLQLRFSLDEGIEAELSRFADLTGFSVEELLELPPQAQAAGDKSGLSRRQLWEKLRAGKLPSLEGRKDRNLRGHRKDAVEISLARLEYYRQLDELLTRAISVQQREIQRQWEIVWPNPAVEMDIFEYARTLPEAQEAPEVAPDEQP